MQKEIKNNHSLIDADDIIETMSQNNISSQKQIELLQIISFALFKKDYPKDTCGIIERKIKILQQFEQEATEKENPNVASIKVRSVVILELLRNMHLGPAQNDLTKICKLLAFLTGNSFKSIYNEMQKGISFSKFHSQQIAEANEIFKELNASISIDINKQY